MQEEKINFEDTKVAFSYKSNKELRNAHFLFSSIAKPWLVGIGTKLVKFALAIHLPIKSIIKKTLFKQFCGGETIEGCSDTLNLLGNHNVKTILDYSVEGMSTEEGFDAAKEELIRVIEYAANTEHIPFAVFKVSGVGDTEVMIKVQAGEKLNQEEETKIRNLETRVWEIIEKANQVNLRVMIDAEESWFQSYIDELTYRLMRKYNQDQALVYNTYQMYRNDMLGRLEDALEQAENENYHLGAKLVRGAYMEKERDRAADKGYPSPIHKDKTSVDRDYNLALKLMMDNVDRIGVCVGTHNENSCNYFVNLIKELGLSTDDERLYLAQLLGMSDNISFKLASMGYNIAKYVPYGPVRKVLPYLFRRAEENTSVAGQTGRELRLIEKEIKRRKTEN